jgi:tetratricopeptide (TPR) repeat protein
LKRQQLILVSSAAVLLLLLLFFGKTIPPKSPKPKPPVSAGSLKPNTFNIDTALQVARSQLSPQQQSYVVQLESSVVRGDVNTQQAARYRQIAEFYKDTAHLLLPFAYYSSEAAKLENSEKSLTFAARFFLESARGQEDEELKRWMANESRDLFERALKINPGNDSLKVGLGSCYLLGDIADNPMQGIMMIREVAERDSSNMYAQYMLGMGAMISGQLDKAIDRLNIVAARQPDNAEVLLMLAEAYERKGEKQQAVKWYKNVKSRVNNPDVSKEIEARIKSLSK